MLKLDINDGEFTCKVELVKNTTYIEQHNLHCSSGSFVISFPDKIPVKMSLLIKELIETDKYIEKLIIYHHSYESMKEFLNYYYHATIETVEKETGRFKFRFYNIRSPDFLKVKRCFEPNCKYIINIFEVMRRLLKKLDKETAIKVWQDEKVQFYCCEHYYEWIGKILKSHLEVNEKRYLK